MSLQANEMKEAKKDSAEKKPKETPTIDLTDP